MTPGLQCGERQPGRRRARGRRRCRRLPRRPRFAGQAAPRRHPRGGSGTAPRRPHRCSSRQRAQRAVRALGDVLPPRRQGTLGVAVLRRGSRCRSLAGRLCGRRRFGCACGIRSRRLLALCLLLERRAPHGRKRSLLLRREEALRNRARRALVARRWSAHALSAAKRRTSPQHRPVRSVPPLVY